MTKHLELYRCEICGNIVQIMHSGDGELVCCGKPMILLTAHAKEDEKQEKHVPIFIDNEVQVGSTAHPMIEEHYIEFIECMSSDKKDIRIKFLNPGNEPKMNINGNTDYSTAFEYCNIHGLWQNTKK